MRWAIFLANEPVSYGLCCMGLMIVNTGFLEST